MYSVGMATLQRRPRKTVEDFMKLPEDVRAELIDGEIYVMSPSPRERHQASLGCLHLRLGAHVESRKLGRVYLGPFDVHLPTGDIVQPDLVFVAQANLGIVQDWIRGTPDLVIEVVSPERPERDRIVKRDLYARNGVPEFWLVDPEDQAIEVLRLVDGRYAPAGYYRVGETLRSAALPSFELRVMEVFA